MLRLLTATTACFFIAACGGDSSTIIGTEGAAGSDAAGAGSEAAAKAAMAEELPKFTPPEGWTSQPLKNEYRIHQYEVPGAEPGEEETVVVATWAGNLGGLHKNLQRWGGEVKMTSEPHEWTAEQRWEKDVRGFFVTVIHLEGELSGMHGVTEGEAPATDGAVLAAFIEKPGVNRVWTVKLAGNAKTIRLQKDSFEAFLESM